MEQELSGLEARARCAGDNVIQIRLPWAVQSFADHASSGNVSEMLKLVLLEIESRHLEYTALLVERADDCVYCLMREYDSIVSWDEESVILCIDAYQIYTAQRYRVQAKPTLVALAVLVCIIGFLALLAFLDVIIPR